MKELIYHRLLLPAVAANADRPCATNAGTGVGTTFAEHLHNVGTTIGGLQSLGVGRGEQIGVPDRVGHVAAAHQHHVLETGLLLHRVDEVGEDGVDEAHLGARVAQHVRQLLGREAEVERIDHAAAEERSVVQLEVLDRVERHHREPVAAADAVIPDEGEETDPVVLMYTGGTTGLPKGVLLDQRAEMLNAYHVFTRLQFDRSTVNLIQTPMFHAASMFGVLGGPAQGAHSVIQPMFEPTAVMKTVRAYQPTSTVMVPTMIGMTMAHPDFTPDGLSSFTDLVYGASPMPQALLEKLLALYPDTNIWQGYGMTESSSVLSFLGPDEHRAGGKYLRSAGKPAMGVVFSIQDDHGNLLPVGTPGEVCARAGNFMIEYWNKPEATTEAFRGGWYHSGDAGYLDSDGYLYLVDRVKDMIVTGGENVYSTEVENAVASHAAVLQVAVIGIPSTARADPS